MKNTLIIFFLVFTINSVIGQDKLLWLKPINVKTEMIVYDKKLRKKNNGYVYPSLKIKLCYKNGQNVYYKNKLVFNSSKHEGTDKSIFLELFGQRFLVVLPKPNNDKGFNTPYSVDREKLFIIDYKNNPSIMFMTNLKGYNLLSSEIMLKKFKDFYKNDESILNGKYGIISSINTGDRTIEITKPNNEKIIFNMTVKGNKSYNK